MEEKSKKEDNVFKLPKKYKELVEEWTNKYGKVKWLDVEGKLIFFKLPTRAELSAAENLSFDGTTGQMDVYKKSEKLTIDCYLGGEYTPEQILDDIELSLAVGEFVLYNLLNKKKVSWGGC
jgi:hypothetical protein